MPEKVSNIYVEDLDLDGDADMMLGSAHAFGLWWLENVSEDAANADGANGASKFIYHLIDDSYSQTHAVEYVDLNGDGRRELVTGKRFYAHNGKDPGGHNRDAAVWDSQSGHYGHCHVPENTHWDPAYSAAEAEFILAATFSEDGALVSPAPPPRPAGRASKRAAPLSTMPDHGVNAVGIHGYLNDLAVQTLEPPGMPVARRRTPAKRSGAVLRAGAAGKTARQAPQASINAPAKALLRAAGMLQLLETSTTTTTTTTTTTATTSSNAAAGEVGAAGGGTAAADGLATARQLPPQGPAPPHASHNECPPGANGVAGPPVSAPPAPSSGATTALSADGSST